MTSLAPLADLPKLRHLELFGVVSEDRSLAALESCKHLASGRFSKFPRREAQRFYEQTSVQNAYAPLPSFDK